MVMVEKNGYFVMVERELLAVRRNVRRKYCRNMLDHRIEMVYCPSTPTRPFLHRVLRSSFSKVGVVRHFSG